MKSVLVTGANGFLGKAVVEHLRSQGHFVISSTREESELSDIQINFESRSFYSKLNELPKLDSIVHLAAKIGFSCNNVSELFISNIAATSTLVALAKHMNAHFIFSSAALIADTTSGIISSQSQDIASTPYMESKLIAENIIKASGVDATILRIGGIFGLNGPSHLGLNCAIQDIIRGQPPTLYGDGNALRNYIYVKDVANIISYVLNKNIYGQHLVAGSDNISIRNMLDLLCKEFAPEKSPLHKNGPAGLDQLIEPSDALIQARSFQSALSDIKTQIYQ